MLWFKKKEKKEKKESDKKQEIIKAVAGMEIAPLANKEEIDLTEYQAVPLTKIANLGVTFLPVMEALKNGGITGEKLYRVIKPAGTHLAEAKDGSGLLGSLIRDGKGVVGQARLDEAGISLLNPMIMSAAIMLIAIDNKLDAIHETGEQILAFLEEKEKAKLEGDFAILMDVFNNYKFNTANKNYKDAKLVQVQDIRRGAERSIKLYQGQLNSELCKQNLLHGNRAVDEKALQIEKIYGNYQQALYMYAFAYFLEVMLTENFDKAYLESVSQTLKKHGEDYGVLYERSCQMIEGYSQTSVESGVAKALSKISMETSKVVPKIPLVKNTKWEEGLLTVSERLDKAREDRTAKSVQKLVLGESEIVAPFVDNIQTVNMMYNERVEFLIDKETLYLKQS